MPAEGCGQAALPSSSLGTRRPLSGPPCLCSCWLAAPDCLLSSIYCSPEQTALSLWLAVGLRPHRRHRMDPGPTLRNGSLCPGILQRPSARCAPLRRCAPSLRSSPAGVASLPSLRSLPSVACCAGPAAYKEYILSCYYVAAYRGGIEVGYTSPHRRRRAWGEVRNPHRRHGSGNRPGRVAPAPVWGHIYSVYIVV